MKMKKLLAVATAGILALSLLGGCGNSNGASSSTSSSASSEEAKTIKAGRIALQEEKGDQPPRDKVTISVPGDSKMEFTDYDNLSAMQMAFDKGDIEVMFVPSIMGRYLTHNNEAYQATSTMLNLAVPFVMGFADGKKELCEKVNKAITQLDLDGVLTQLSNKYIYGDVKAFEAIKFENFPGADTLTVAVTGDMPPLDYINTDGTPAGFNTALLAEIGKNLKMNIKTVNIEAGARSSAIASGKADAAFWYFSLPGNTIEKLGKNTFKPDGVIFSDPYFVSREAVGIQKTETAKKADEDKTSVIGSLSLANSSEESIAKDDASAAANNEFFEVGGNMLGKSARKFYDSLAAMQMALDKGEIEGFMVPDFTAGYLLNSGGAYKAKEALVFCSGHYCMGVNKGQEKLRDRLNTAIATIRSEEKGNLAEKYIFSTEKPEPVEMPTFNGAETLTVAVTGDAPPLDYINADGTPAGYNTALIAEIAKELKVNIKLISVESGARSAALSSGKADIVFWYRGSRGSLSSFDVPENVLLTDSYLVSNTQVIMTKAN